MFSSRNIKLKSPIYVEEERLYNLSTCGLRATYKVYGSFSMHTDDLRTLLFLEMMEPPRWNTGIYPMQKYRLHGIKCALTKIFIIFIFKRSTYRVYSDWNVEVLSTIVFLECVDIIPDLRGEKQKSGKIKTVRGKMVRNFQTHL